MIQECPSSQSFAPYAARSRRLARRALIIWIASASLLLLSRYTALGMPILRVRDYAGLIASVAATRMSWKILFLAGFAALISSQAFSQTDASLATPTGHELNASVGSYTYTEPGAQRISIHGVKVE